MLFIQDMLGMWLSQPEQSSKNWKNRKPTNPPTLALGSHLNTMKCNKLQVSRTDKCPLQKISQVCNRRKKKND